MRYATVTHEQGSQDDAFGMHEARGSTSEAPHAEATANPWPSTSTIWSWSETAVTGGFGPADFFTA